MSEPSINFRSTGFSKAAGGLNKYDLLQSVSDEIRDKYSAVFQKTEGSLTTVSDNDTHQKIKVAIATLSPNNIQLGILKNISTAFSSIENSIDPSRLQFAITKGTDDEICLQRNSNNGASNLIINEDGVVVFSFIAYKGCSSKDIFDVYEDHGAIDFEQLSYHFFAI